MEIREVSREKYKKKFETKKEHIEIVIQEIEFIDEKTYQQFKKKMCKNDNYFDIKEWCGILKHRKE